MIESVKTFFDNSSACLTGENVIRKQTLLESLENIYQDSEAFATEDKKTVIYEVEMHDNGLKEGDKGGIFFGISHIYPGKVGSEFHMTRGHVHENFDTGEYYWGIKGSGLLLMTLEDGTSKSEKVEPNSLHYIPGKTAHRLINTGTEKLSVGAAWLSESGHNYGTGQALFKQRVVEKDSEIVVVEY